MSTNFASGTPTRINTATTTVISAGECKLLAVFCAASTSGTLSFKDAAHTVLTGALTAVAGTTYQIPMDCPGGLEVTTTGTIDITVFSTKPENRL